MSVEIAIISHYGMLSLNYITSYTLKLLMNLSFHNIPNFSLRFSDTLVKVVYGGANLCSNLAQFLKYTSFLLPFLILFAAASSPFLPSHCSQCLPKWELKDLQQAFLGLRYPPNEVKKQINRPRLVPRNNLPPDKQKRISSTHCHL